jgi:hypothetical protein
MNSFVKIQQEIKTIEECPMYVDITQTYAEKKRLATEHARIVKDKTGYKSFDTFVDIKRRQRQNDQACIDLFEYYDHMEWVQLRRRLFHLKKQLDAANIDI